MAYAKRPFWASDKDAPGFLSNLVTKPGVCVDTPDGCNWPDDMSPYQLTPREQLLHQGAMNPGDYPSVGNRSGKAKTLKVE